MQIHLAVPTEESCENCHNSTEIIFLSCFNGLVPYWSTQRSWPLENTAIKNLHLDIQEKSLHSFLLWTGCMCFFFQQKELWDDHIQWGLTSLCLLKLVRLLWVFWNCCTLIRGFWSVLLCVWTQLHPKVNCRWWVSWNSLLRMSTCLLIILGEFGQPILVQKAQI